MPTRPDASVFGELANALSTNWRRIARASQLPPLGDWIIWLILAGRGFGKTRTGSETVRQKKLAGCMNIGLIGATAADVRDTMIEGPSGILTISPKHDRPLYEPSKRRLTWANGAIATAFSAEEADRLRGPQFDFLWADELAAWDYPAAWDMALFCLRQGKKPQALVTTTPRPTKIIRDLVNREGRDVAVTRGSTFENAANLAPSFLSEITKRYQGTRLGRQELQAEILDDVPGALWQRAWIDRDRRERAPELKRIVIAIDPAVKSGDDSDETGIVAAGVGHDGHGYVLQDLSGRYAPHEWAKVAVAAYHRHQADRIVAEVNNGGEMVESVLRQVDASVPFKAVTASRGKVTRAEPVAALYEQGKVHHVGAFDQLEDQCCAFASDFDRSKAGYSPDRMDALVWAMTELIARASYVNAVSFHAPDLSYGGIGGELRRHFGETSSYHEDFTNRMPFSGSR
jgi:predicted phage terminase large subunit-like protein